MCGHRRVDWRDRTEDAAMAMYVLLAIVVGLVIYLFYAVINPEKF
ncbi:MAG: K(+)-transporting ATPase subunit F [Xanthobacteraceae bacterium]|nr:K(+)-transporting ATPase subunit F [Xanthobacteraceae bacterium]MBV9628445.1 K(+)-transporting ATPase subunit F [Xanthobacteraceae bacterium]